MDEDTYIVIQENSLRKLMESVNAAMRKEYVPIQGFAVVENGLSYNCQIVYVYHQPMVKKTYYTLTMQGRK